jgi:hypothetical protein
LPLVLARIASRVRQRSDLVELCAVNVAVNLAPPVRLDQLTLALYDGFKAFSPVFVGIRLASRISNAYGVELGQQPLRGFSYFICHLYHSSCPPGQLLLQRYRMLVKSVLAYTEKGKVHCESRDRLLSAM